jgi:hypothetical protein
VLIETARVEIELGALNLTNYILALSLGCALGDALQGHGCQELRGLSRLHSPGNTHISYTLCVTPIQLHIDGDWLLQLYSALLRNRQNPAWVLRYGVLGTTASGCGIFPPLTGSDLCDAFSRPEFYSDF